MVIVGAKGFAKEVCEVLFQLNYAKPIAFFDNVSQDLPALLFAKYPVLKNMDAFKEFISKGDNSFILGIGNPVVRYKLSKMLVEAGGNLETIVSPFARIGLLGNKIGQGCNIMTGTVITSDIQIGESVLINLNCTIGHDTIIERYCELSPGVHLSGHTHVGEFSVLGTGAVVIPKVTIGKNVIVAAGSVVTKDVPDNVLVAGAPAVVKKELTPIQL